MKTKLILREDHPALGNTGDVVEVSSGYARNYLLPRGLAYAFSEDAMLRIEKARLEAEDQRAAMRADMEALSKRLVSVQLTFEENANDSGHLYGAVTTKRIAEALAEHGLDIPDAHIKLPEPIRQTGEYAVEVHVHADIETEIQVWVVSTTPTEASPTVETVVAETAAAAEAAAEESAASDESPAAAGEEEQSPAS